MSLFFFDPLSIKVKILSIKSLLSFVLYVIQCLGLSTQSEQNTVLFKVQKNKTVTFNVLEQILQENKGRLPANL